MASEMLINHTGKTVFLVLLIPNWRMLPSLSYINAGFNTLMAANNPKNNTTETVLTLLDTNSLNIL